MCCSKEDLLAGKKDILDEQSLLAIEQDYKYFFK